MLEPKRRLPRLQRAFAASPRLSAAVLSLNPSQLERLRGAIEPEKLFRIIPGVGPGLAGKLHDELHVDTLEALEAAARDGRLAGVRSIGARRVQMIKTALAERLGRPSLRRKRLQAAEPSVGLILDVDREYQDKARNGLLRTIAPKRFNPTGEAWLPVLHTHRDDWRFTALCSNSRLAHELGRLKDWVIIYFESDLAPEGQCTVVTETTGPLKGLRVVRGRERECADHHALPSARSVQTSVEAPVSRMNARAS
jgi:hypothetical protein